MRGKIILPNILAILLVGLGGYFFLGADLDQRARARLSADLVITAGLFERSEGLQGFELLNEAQTQARSRDVVDAFAPVDTQAEEGETQEQLDSRIRKTWIGRIYRAVETVAELVRERRGKLPEFAFLTDRNGLVLARNTTPNACPAGYNVSKAMPIFARALDGEPTYAIWSIDDSPFRSANPDKDYCQLMNTGLLELAAAPVWVNDAVAGVLVLAFEKSNGTAKAKSQRIGVDLAVMKGGHVHSSSLTTDSDRQSLDQALGQDEIVAKINAVLDEGVRSDVFNLSVQGREYLAVISPVPNAEKKDRVVSVLLGSVATATQDLESLVFLLVFMGVALLLAIIAGVLLGNHFLGPVMAIEEGLLKVINGEYNYRFDVKSAEVGGLSYRINQLIGVLTGEEEEEEE